MEERAEETVVVLNHEPLRWSALRNLWRISFAHCKQLPSDLDLSPLRQYACLGLVDLSFTNIDLKQIQSSFRTVSIIRFNFYGSPLLGSGIPAGEWSKSRGFLAFVLPRVWVLNGVYITCLERQRWNRYYESEASGMYSTLARKWKLDEKPSFSLSKDDATAILHPRLSQLWLGFPQFMMGSDLDRWKLNMLAQHLGST
ncbi:hypothetical protein HDU91_007527, partial [Kappamyces sp. JEL0680]